MKNTKHIITGKLVEAHRLGFDYCPPDETPAHWHELLRSNKVVGTGSGKWGIQTPHGLRVVFDKDWLILFEDGSLDAQTEEEFPHNYEYIR